MSKEQEQVVIVGAGMAGLSAAAYLGRENYKVTLIEKNNRTGGLVNTFERDGFYFDNGPRAFVNSGMVKPILKDLEIPFEVVKNDISIAIGQESFVVENMGSIEEYKKLICSLYPEEEKNVEKLFKKITKLSKYTQVLYEFDNPYFVDYFSDKKFLIKEFLPWTIRLLYALKQFKKYNMPMEDFLRKYTKNESLVDILTQFFFKKTPTYFALGYFPVWLDYFYPKGGTGSLPKVVEEKVLETGVEIKRNTTIDKVISRDSKVIDSNGECYEYDHLIWAADLKSLYHKLDTNGLENEVVELIKGKAKDIFESKAAESSYTLYLGVDRPASCFEKISGEHSFYTKSKRGLVDTNKVELEKLLERFDVLSKKDVLDWLDLFCEFNTYEVSIPVLRDQELAPENKTGIMISCLFSYDLARKISDAGWIDEFKVEFENRIIKLFSESYFPNLEEDVLFRFSSTPLTISRSIESSDGSIVGWSFETKSPVYNDLKNMPKSAQTPIPNVYQAGQWAYAPAGVPIAMLTGWHASQEIIKKK